MSNPRYSKSKDVAKEVSRLVRRGWLYSLNSGGHGKLTAPSGGSITLSSSPSDGRALMNLRADVRRLEKPR